MGIGLDFTFSMKGKFKRIEPIKVFLN